MLFQGLLLSILSFCINSKKSQHMILYGFFYYHIYHQHGHKYRTDVYWSQIIDIWQQYGVFQNKKNVLYWNSVFFNEILHFYQSSVIISPSIFLFLAEDKGHVMMM